VNINIDQKAFMKILSYIQSISDKKSTMPILSYFLMEALDDNKLKFFATDLNVGLTVESKAEVITPGSMLLPSKRLYSIVHELPEKTVNLATGDKEGWCTLKCEKSRFKLPFLETSSFPKKPVFPEEISNTLPSELLMEIIDKTLFAAATEETRYNLNCIFMKKISENEVTRVVATDGHRLVQWDIEELKDLLLEDAIMIPKRGMMELKRVLNEARVNLVGFDVKDKNAYFRMDNVGMIIRLIDGSYPDYQQVIPKRSGIKIYVNRWDLITGLKRVSQISTDLEEGTKFHFRPGEIELTMGNSNTGIARETVKITYDGYPVTFAFNGRYCQDILNAFEDEEIEIELLDEDNPGIFRERDKSNIFYLIMPMKIEEEEEDEQSDE